MAKAILEFNLEDQEDRMAHMRCVKSLDMAIVLFQITSNLKRDCENNITKNLSTSEVIDEVFQKIYDLMDENSIDLGELIN